MKLKSSERDLSLFFNLLLFTGLLSKYFFGSSYDRSTFAIAYLDPGTGTMIISAIVGIFATLALGIKTFWYKFSHIFKPRAGKSVDGKTDRSNTK